MWRVIKNKNLTVLPFLLFFSNVCFPALYLVGTQYLQKIPDSYNQITLLITGYIIVLPQLSKMPLNKHKLSEGLCVVD